MSWRLEQRDLSGNWYLPEQELGIVTELLQQLRPQSHLSSHELSEIFTFHGNDWLKHYKQTLEELAGVKAKKKNISKRLTPRLQGVMDLYKFGQVNIDLGTDHAHLPLLLVRSQKAPLAFGVDIALSPLRTAYNALQKTNMLEDIALIHSDGIEAFVNASEPLTRNSQQVFHSFSDGNWQLWQQLKDAQLATVTICGVGGALAAELISLLPTWVSELIVQANDQPELVDQALEFTHEKQALTLDEISATIENNRLFINKRARSLVDSNQNPSKQNHNIQYDKHHALWRWVLLSRASRRLALTPQSHSSMPAKYALLEQSAKGFCTLYDAAMCAK